MITTFKISFPSINDWLLSTTGIISPRTCWVSRSNNESGRVYGYNWLKSGCISDNQCCQRYVTNLSTGRGGGKMKHINLYWTAFWKNIYKVNIQQKTYCSRDSSMQHGGDEKKKLAEWEEEDVKLHGLYKVYISNSNYISVEEPVPTSTGWGIGSLKSDKLPIHFSVLFPVNIILSLKMCTKAQTFTWPLCTNTMAKHAVNDKKSGDMNSPERQEQGRGGPTRDVSWLRKGCYWASSSGQECQVSLSS